MFSGIVAVSTVVYAVLTWKLVRETQLLRKSETTPQIGVYLQPSSISIHFFDVVIENHGRAAAHSIRWDAGLGREEKERKGVYLGFLDQLDGLTYMAPGQRIQSFFGAAIELLQHDPVPTVVLRVDYRDAQGAQYESTYVLDPAKYKGLRRIGQDPSVQGAKALEEIAKTFREVVTHSRIRVIRTTEEDF